MSNEYKEFGYCVVCGEMANDAGPRVCGPCMASLKILGKGIRLHAVSHEDTGVDLMSCVAAAGLVQVDPVPDWTSIEDAQYEIGFRLDLVR